jgi:hypothetical protein
MYFRTSSPHNKSLSLFAEVSVSQGVKKPGNVIGVQVLVLTAHRAVDRVALARAVYARTKYVLLDDPLSAVVSIHSPIIQHELTNALHSTG